MSRLPLLTTTSHLVEFIVGWPPPFSFTCPLTCFQFPSIGFHSINVCNFFVYHADHQFSLIWIN